MNSDQNRTLTSGTPENAGSEGPRSEQGQESGFVWNIAGRKGQPSSETRPVDPCRRMLLAGMVAGLVALGVPKPVLALSLDDARNQGLVGERRDGYIGVVRGGAGVDALVSSVNAQRRAQYKRTASDTGRALSEVEAIAGQQLIGRARSGWFVQDSGGGWRKK